MDYFGWGSVDSDVSCQSNRSLVLCFKLWWSKQFILIPYNSFMSLMGRILRKTSKRSLNHTIPFSD